MTKQERHLWYDYLRSRPIKFRRQVPIDKYIVDFYCDALKIAIEVDGSQHYEDSGKKYDEERTAVLNSYGITVIRFSNLDIDKNFNGVCEIINIEINNSDSLRRSK